MTTIIFDRYNKVIICCLSMLVSLLTTSCSDTKYIQCEQIIQIANSVVREKNKLIDNNSSVDIESKTWLRAARMINQAALRVEAINLQDPQLIKYQTDLAEVYRIYSQATYDAVRAWESKNIQELQVAHKNAAKAGQLEAKLGSVINNYCGDQK